jgi:hypothetical protein
MVQTNTATQGSAPPAGGGAVVPFFYGTNQYAEKFNATTQTLGTAQAEVNQNIPPGGFMRGVRLEMRAASGVIGTGAVSADGPWTALASVGVENVDGAPIQYPMSAYTHMARNLFSRPWHGDPARRFDFSNTVNPSGSLFMQPEIRQSAGVLANTDARSQYRLKYTFATLTQFLGTVGTATAPAVTVTPYLESWAQPDKEDLRGYPIEETPPGLQMTTIARHQVLNLSAAGSDNTLQMSNVGNEIRLSLMIFRNSSGLRADLASNPVRWRLDNRSLGTFGVEEIYNRMADFYPFLQNGSTRPTGILAFPRFFDPGRMVGEAWMATNNATYQIWETQTATGGTGGNVEIVTDEVVPVGTIPMELESI